MKKDSQTMKHQGELYRVFVAVNELCKQFSKERHLGAPARGLLEVLSTVTKTAMDAHRDGGLVDVHMDVYVPTALPGWEIDNDGDVTSILDEAGDETVHFGGTEIFP